MRIYWSIRAWPCDREKGSTVVEIASNQRGADRDREIAERERKGEREREREKEKKNEFRIGSRSDADESYEYHRAGGMIPAMTFVDENRSNSRSHFFGARTNFVSLARENEEDRFGRKKLGGTSLFFRQPGRCRCHFRFLETVPWTNVNERNGERRNCAICHSLSERC